MALAITAGALERIAVTATAAIRTTLVTLTT